MDVKIARHAFIHYAWSIKQSGQWKFSSKSASWRLHPSVHVEVKPELLHLLRLFFCDKNLSCFTHCLALHLEQKTQNINWRSINIFPTVFTLFFFWKTESAENVPSVQTGLQQAVCQASKLLLTPARDDKRLEVKPVASGTILMRIHFKLKSN